MCVYPYDGFPDVGKQGEVCTYLPIWSELEFVVVRVIAEWSTELGHHVVDGTDVHLSLGFRVCAIVKFLWSWVVNVSPHLAPGYTAEVPVVVCLGVCNHEVQRVTSSSTSSGSVHDEVLLDLARSTRGGHMGVSNTKSEESFLITSPLQTQEEILVVEVKPLHTGYVKVIDQLQCSVSAK